MILPKTWKRTALWLGLGWSILWSLVLCELPITQQSDRWISDRLLRYTIPSSPPSEIVLVTLSAEDLKNWGTTNELTRYSTLVKRLLDRGADGVVLNLLPSWLQTSDHPNHPIKTLIQTHRDRLVVVLPITSVAHGNPAEWRSYEYILPIGLREPLVAPESILGFVEYEPEGQHPQSLMSTARQIHLTGELIDSFHRHLPIALKSFALLSLNHFKPQALPLHTPPSPLQIQFWGATGTFPTLDAQTVLSDRPFPISIRHKIVLVGFSDLQNLDSFAIRSPFGEMMPGLEWQANILASLLTRSYFQIVPLWLQRLLIVLGSVVLSGWLMREALQPTRDRWRYGLLPVVGVGIFVLFCGGLWWQRWILPPTLPLLTWGATGLSIWFSMRLGMQNDLIHRQQCELDRLHRVEQQAVISQAQKLLHRIAANIHDGPLQELKLVMDRLELLQLHTRGLNIDPVLDQLEDLGKHLRQHLSETRAITLRITPELRQGLDQAIAAYLQQQVEGGELILHVVQHVEPLDEPTLNSLWLEAREDIYRFFCEAIHKVMYHAQPPHGTATQVTVCLKQADHHCTLSIENDGKVLNPRVFQPTAQQRQRGGYGTKLMDTIAAELPQGNLQRMLLKSGGLRVQLTWYQHFGLN